MTVHTTALAVFIVLFLLVTVAGFWAARWRRPAAGIHSLEEWGLAGRSFAKEFLEDRTARYFNTRLPGVQRAV